MRKSDDYAGNQVRILLNDLKNASHSVKIKAVEKFQTYITQYDPEITDDTVDYLYTGFNGVKADQQGLIYWSGASSGKHGGQLKRICASIISLIRWLVMIPSDEEFGNIYYERFVHLPMTELSKVNFEIHINAVGSGDGKFGNQSRMGNCDDAMQLLSILNNDHRNPEGEDDPIDLKALLHGNGACLEHFNKWLQKQTADHISKTTAQFKVIKAARAMEVDSRPTRWEDVAVKAVPWQEGEEGSIELSIEEDEVPPVHDPLGLAPGDLRITQELYITGRLFKTQTGGFSRRATAFLGSPNKSTREISTDFGDGDDDSSENEDESAAPATGSSSAREPQSASSTGKSKALQSVLPSDKTFSTALFLSLVHGSASFADLQQGVLNLGELLTQQSGRRENLVRLHFGLFVQCADGLEWLKAFRKGVYKVSEMPMIRSYRRSSVETAAQQVKVGGGADKGMEKLRRAQTTLDFAKVEAQSTLAPILERMKQSRRVRSAEKVLRRMAAVLEHPHKMRLALDRGDLQEVVLIYQRVQAIPSTISLRILQRVKTAADALVGEMKKQLTVALMTPSTNHHMLLRYSKIILDLDGTTPYLDLLRQCIVRQVLHFVELAKEIKDRFCSDAAEAFAKSQELNMMNRSAFYSAQDKEVLATALRKFAHVSSPRHRPPSSSKKPSRRGSGAGSFYLPSEEEAERTAALLRSSADEFDVADDEEEAPEESDWLDLERDSVAGDDSPAEGGVAPGTWEAANKNSSSEVDTTVQLSAHVRQHYLELAVDTFAKWFPCLLRLVSEYLTVQAATQKKTVVSAASSAMPFLSAGNKSVSMGALPPQRGLMAQQSSVGANSNFFNNKAALRPPVTKLLGGAMRLYSDFIKHVVRGVNGPFQAFAVSPELMTAFGELDAKQIRSAAAASSQNLNAVAAAPHPLDPNLNAPVDAKQFEVLSSSVFASALQNPFHAAILREIYVLYAAVEETMNSSVAVTAILAANKAAAPTALTAASTSPFARQLVPFAASVNLTGGASAATAANENYFLVASSPYYDAMNTLQSLSKEGQTQVAHKIMDRLLSLTYKLCEFNAHSAASTPEDLATSDPFAPQQLDGGAKSTKTVRSDKGGGAVQGSRHHIMKLEQAVHDMEALVSRCLGKVAATIKRSEWVAAVVHEGVAKACMAFADTLRRESMLIEDSRSGLAHHSDIGGGQGSPNTNKRSRKKSAGARASVSNGLVLQTIEEELKQGALQDQLKGGLMLDLLRACIRLRNCSLPRINKTLNKRFHLPQNSQNAFDSLVSSITGGAAGSTVPFSGAPEKASSSLLNKLFTFDAVSPEVATRKQAKKASIIAPPPATKANPANTTPPAKEGLKAAIKPLIDRLTGSLDEELLGPLLPTASELAGLEDRTVVSYLEQRRKEVHGAVYAGYHLLARKEVAGKWIPLLHGDDPATAIPTHLSRVLLMVGREKTTLSAELGKLTVELGGRTALKNTRSSKAVAQSRWPKKRNAVEDDNERGDESEEEEGYDDSFGDQEDEQQSADLAAGSLLEDSSAGLRYSSHIYFELCHGLLDLYAELVEKLRSNAFLAQTASSANTGAACLTPITLGQATEEQEYLKAVLKPIMVAHSITAGSTSSIAAIAPKPSSRGASSSTRAEYFLSSEQLAADAKLFSMLLTN